MWGASPSFAKADAAKPRGFGKGHSPFLTLEIVQNLALSLSFTCLIGLQTELQYFVGFLKKNTQKIPKNGNQRFVRPATAFEKRLGDIVIIYEFARL